MEKHINKKEGYASLLFLFITASLLPIALFFMVELKQGFYAKESTQYLIDRAVDAALLQVDKDELAKGNIVLDESRAVEAAETLLNEGFNKNLSRSGLSYTINIIQDDVSGSDDESYPIVSIESSFQGKGIFISRFNDIKNKSESQITWGKENDEEVFEGDSNGGIKVSTLSVVNPKSYSSGIHFPVENAKDLKLLEHSQIELLVENIGSGERVIDGLITLSSENEEVFSLKASVRDNREFKLYIPEGVSKGEEQNLTLKVDLKVIDQEGIIFEKSYEEPNYGVIVGNTNELLELNKQIE